MVIYKLGIKDRKTFDLSSIITIDAKNSLTMIDKFTSNFDSEQDLKKYLLDKKIINNEDYYSKINIIYQNNKVNKTLPVVYSKGSKMINILSVINRLNHLIFDEANKEFIKELLDYYDYNIENNPQAGNMFNLKLILSDLEYFGKDALVFDRKIIEITIQRIVDVAAHKYDKKTKSQKFNYRGLRDLAMIIYKFEELEQLRKIKHNLEEDNSVIKEKNIDKFILSSEGDPDFPFNSEEEKQYLRLQEQEYEEWLEKIEEETKEREKILK